MQAQLDNKVMSSFLLWLDHTICSRGVAYTSFSSKFYKVSNSFNGVFSYGLPFKQVVADSSLTGVPLLTGIYINNTLIGTGTSGLIDIDYEQGTAYFSSSKDAFTISGAYGVKDYNIYLTTHPDESLLFETKYETRPKVARDLTGLAPDKITFPAIFLKNNGSENVPFSFGGLDCTTYSIRAIVLSDRQFHSDAVCSILRDRVRTYIPLIEESEMPFNSRGGYKGGVYNYNTLTANKGESSSMFVDEVSISHFNRQSVIVTELKDLNPTVIPAMIDFVVKIYRQPRT